MMEKQRNCISGRLTSSEQGRYFLEKQQAISLLINLLSSRMDVYLKLIVSSIDYRQVATNPYLDNLSLKKPIYIWKE